MSPWIAYLAGLGTTPAVIVAARSSARLRRTRIAWWWRSRRTLRRLDGR